MMLSPFPFRKASSLCHGLVLALFLSGCNGTDDPPQVINVGFDGGTQGCTQQSFPSNEPDIPPLSPPIFLLTAASQNTVGQAQARPGDVIPAEVTVNGATRIVRVELANAWSPTNVIFSDELETRGNEVVSLDMESTGQTRGRYFMRLTLCGADCDERQVVFDLVPCSDAPDAGPCGIRTYYERTVIEDGEVVRVDDTCIDLGSTPNVGSGTVVIQ